MKIKYTLFLLPAFLLATSLVLGHAAAAKIKVKKTSGEKILQTSLEWQNNYKNYQVDESFLDTLKAKTGDNLKIDVYLGSWCSDSLNHVPAFIKIMAAAQIQDTAVNYFEVDKKPNKNVKYYVKELKVEKVPTFIFSRRGKELGRIVENPTNSLIEDIVEIIF